MKKTIYIADDEENIRDLIYLFLTNEGFDVTAFSNGDDLLKAFLQKPADMVILDVMMPGIDGFSLCTQIRKRSNTLIIIVSARDNEIDRITGITLGSDDYMTKPFSPMELVARAKALFRRMELDTGGVSASMLTSGNLKINMATREAEIDAHPFDMTPTELALMVYLLQNSTRAVSREELLKNVWKFDFDVDTRATDDVVKRLRKKLSAAGSTIKIDSVWGYGFKLSREGA
ncbi:MAG: response regulator with CheY-like receiver domain and winged-helix DNA-binding domain [Caproiciproducens sp.]|nr:response regulator with CheY-like receiver domain and winged-helix DNA-binding domain [Caproiciproducens sp.]